MTTVRIEKVLAEFVLPKGFKAEQAIKEKEAALTPDCQVLSFSIDGDSYVLYTEDYIESLDYVKQEIEAWFKGKVVNFFEAKNKQVFDKTPGAKFYMDPRKEITDKWLPYAVTNGSYYLFLAKVQPSKHKN